jgi:uncharacterized metal-binding protein YceD (DUF177 family)
MYITLTKGNNRTEKMAIAHEFSRPVSIDGIIPDRLRKETIEATDEECAALAKRFDLRSLSGLKATMAVLRVSEGRIIRVEGDIEADVVQACVVSLQDVHAEVKTHFDTYFTEDGKEQDPDAEFSIDLEDGMQDVIEAGVLDLGELVAQHLSLDLDPYPRAPGVSLAAQMAEVGEGAKNRPFLNVLQSLIGKKDEK